MYPLSQLKHFFNLPIITPLYAKELESCLEQFNADMIAAGDFSLPSLKSIAFRPVASVHLGIDLEFVEPDRIAAASEFIQHLNLYDIFKKSSESVKAKTVTVDNAPSTATLAQESSEFGKAKIVDGDDTPAPATLTQESSDLVKVMTVTADDAPIPTSPTQESSDLAWKSLVQPLTAMISSLPDMPYPYEGYVYDASTDPDCRLYPFFQALREAFTSAGFPIDDDEPVFLQMTLSDMLFAKDQSARARKIALRKAKRNEKQRYIAKMNMKGVARQYKNFFAPKTRVSGVKVLDLEAGRVFDDDVMVDERYTDMLSIFFP
ncbi:hypothetical protein MMC12_008281 [Toensbergia leucococca]|nr:hypothetical protein [Toensbergia leucococca]